MFIPYHWGNQYFSTKINFLEKKKLEKFNLFFFGSSRVNRQIVPSLFDSIVNAKNQLKIKSFNLGSPATFCPQNYYLYENFVKTKESRNMKYCLIELMSVTPISDFFYHREQTNYWIGAKELRFVFKSINSDVKYKKEFKSKHIKRYVNSYIENILHLGHLGKPISTDNFYDSRFLGSNFDGYSMEAEWKL